MYSNFFIDGMQDGMTKEGSAAAKSLISRLQRAGSRGTASDPGMMGRLFQKGISGTEKKRLAELAGASHFDERQLEKLLTRVGRREDLGGKGAGKLADGLTTLGAGGAGAGGILAALSGKLMPAAATAAKAGAGAKAGASAATGGAGLLGGLAGLAQPAIGLGHSMGAGLATPLVGAAAAPLTAGIGMAGLGAAGAMGAKRGLTNLVRHNRIKNMATRIGGGGDRSALDDVLVDALKNEARKIDNPAINLLSSGRNLLGSAFK